MTDVKPKEKAKSERERMQDFADEYSELCEKYGFALNITPAFKARDDGTWSVVLQTSIGRLRSGSR